MELILKVMGNILNLYERFYDNPHATNHFGKLDISDLGDANTKFGKVRFVKGTFSVEVIDKATGKIELKEFEVTR